MSSGTAWTSRLFSRAGWEKAPRLSLWRRSNSTCCSVRSLGGDGPGEKREAIGDFASRLDSVRVLAVERR